MHMTLVYTYNVYRMVRTVYVIYSKSCDNSTLSFTSNTLSNIYIIIVYKLHIHADICT